MPRLLTNGRVRQGRGYGRSRSRSRSRWRLGGEAGPLDLFSHVWEADAGISVADGSGLATWEPVKGGVDLLQPTGSVQPTFRTSAAANGSPSVEFTSPGTVAGAVDFMEAAIGNVGAGNTVIVVMQPKSIGTQNTLIDQTSNIGVLNNKIATFGATVATNERFTEWGLNADTAANIVATGFYPTTGSTNMYAAAFDGADSFMRVNRIKGPTVNAGTRSMGDFRLGADASKNFGLDAYVHGIYIAPDVLTDAQVDAFLAYCQAKWGVTTTFATGPIDFYWDALDYVAASGAIAGDPVASIDSQVGAHTVAAVSAAEVNVAENGVIFTGSEYYQAASYSPPTGDNPRTIITVADATPDSASYNELWNYGTNTSAKYYGLFPRRDFTNTWDLAFWSAGEIESNVASDGGVVQTVAVSLEKNYDTYTFGGDRHRIFVDGVQEGQTNAQRDTGSTRDLTIGARFDGSGGYKGDLHALLVLPYTASAAEIAAWSSLLNERY